MSFSKNPVRLRRLKTLILPAALFVCSALAPGQAILTPASDTVAPDGTPPPAPTTQVTDDKVVQMQTLTVTSKREKGTTTEGPEPIQTYDSAQIADSGAFSVQDFIEDLPPGEDGTEILVLIDGQPSNINPATLPLGMIESIKVSLAGSMPEHGAFAQGIVINITLKKMYEGGEIGERIRGSFEGGGFRQNTKLSYSITRGKWQTFFSLDYSKSNELLASDRIYSRNQDHTARGGSDLRVAWGTPAVVQAVSGNLAGILDAQGQAVSSALVPENQNGLSLAPANFIPGNTALSANAQGQRRYNTAAYRMLASPSTQYDGNLGLTYKFNDKYKLSLSGNVATSESDRIGAPPVTAASSKTLVPAAYNPFGQDIQVGLVHEEFGPTIQNVRSTNAQVGLKFNAKPTSRWTYNGGIAYQNNKSTNDATDLDKDKFTASLAAADPALRFNPFGDPRNGPVNAHLYPDLTIHRTRKDINENTRLDLSTNIQFVELPAGPARLALVGNYNNQQRDRGNSHPNAGTPPTSHQSVDSGSASAAITVPIFAKQNALPLLYRLETETSFRENRQSDNSRRRNLTGGLVWSPVRGLLLRTRYSEFINTPSSTIIAGSESLVGQTFIDRARDDETVTDVLVFNRETVSAVPGKTDTHTFGLTFEPNWIKGLRFTASHNTRQRHNIYQRSFNSQEIINNEGAFPGRVIRAAPTPEDIALGLPGRITAIDTTPGNTGESENRDINLSLEYRLPTQRFGRIQFRAYATRVLEASYQVYPGIEYISRNGGDNNPPEWTFQSQASWNHKGWNSVIRMNYTGALMTAPVDSSENTSITIVNFDLSYQFKKAIWGNFGKQLRLGIGVMNCLDKEPLYADTISGYRGISPLGRMYTCAVTVPL